MVGNEKRQSEMLLGRYHSERTCITLPSELQCDQRKCENASRPGAVKNHRFRAGSVFDHIDDHRQLRDTCETQVYRCLKSIRNRLKSTEKHYKSPEKTVSLCLGAGCRRFESCHSDQTAADDIVCGGLFYSILVYFPAGPAVSAPSPMRPSSFAASWRILYFKILPAAFMGKPSTNLMYLGTLWRAMLALI